MVFLFPANSVGRRQRKGLVSTKGFLILVRWYICMEASKCRHFLHQKRMAENTLFSDVRSGKFAYMQIGSPLVQIMACHLFGAKPLSKPMLGYYQPSGTNFSEIWIAIKTFSFTKMHLKILSAKRQPFCLRLHVLTSLKEWYNQYHQQSRSVLNVHRFPGSLECLTFEGLCLLMAFSCLYIRLVLFSTCLGPNTISNSMVYWEKPHIYLHDVCILYKYCSMCNSLRPNDTYMCR